MVDKPSVEVFDAMVNAVRAQASVEALIDLLIEKGLLPKADAARLYNSVAYGLENGVHREHLVIPAKAAAAGARQLALFYATVEPPASSRN